MTSSPSSSAPSCTELGLPLLPSPAAVDALGVLLAVGALLSYAPQVRAVLLAASARGLSFHSLLLHAVTNTSTLMASVLARYDAAHCACSGASAEPSGTSNGGVAGVNVAHACFSATLPLVQLGVSVVGIHVLWTTAVWYSDGPRNDEWRRLWVYLGMQWYVAGGALLWLMIVNQRRDAAAVAVVTTVLNVAASAANTGMWLPQIYVTLRSAQRGTLSGATLLMQCTGSVAATAFLVAKHMPPGVVAPFVINAVSLGVLSVLWARLWWRDRRAATAATPVAATMEAASPE